jgi:CheY-like chemotaxis protein
VHTLLLADDSVTIQRVIELIFADQDVRVVAVGDGDQAIQRLDAAPPDIVLADTGMPGRNGYEVARYVKQSPRLAHIPVVLLTGAFEPVDPAQARAAGCDGILAKPFEPQLVISRVQQLLAGPPPAPAAVDEPAARPIEAPLQSIPPAVRETPAAAPSARASELDAYFDHLGKAFAERLSAPAETAPQPGAPSDVPDQGPPDASGAARETDAVPQTADLSTASALAEKFAALLAAEQGRQPVKPIPAGSGAAIDDIVEQVTRRVLAQLTDRVVRETVADLVPAIAERLVREEIDRIKGSIK